MPKYVLDEIDRKIISHLQVDARITNQNLSQAVGLSPSPCLRRVRMLEEAGKAASAYLQPRESGKPALDFGGEVMDVVKTLDRSARLPMRWVAPLPGMRTRRRQLRKRREKQTQLRHWRLLFLAAHLHRIWPAFYPMVL